MSLDTAVQQLRKRGVIVFAVGVGDAHELAALEQLTVRKDLMFHAADFLDLYVKAGFIARRICQHTRKSRLRAYTQSLVVHDYTLFISIVTFVRATQRLEQKSVVIRKHA